jgi:hypothetical protein
MDIEINKLRRLIKETKGRKPEEPHAPDDLQDQAGQKWVPGHHNVIAKRYADHHSRIAEMLKRSARKLRGY